MHSVSAMSKVRLPLIKSAAVVLLAACLFWTARFGRIFGAEFLEMSSQAAWLISLAGYFGTIAGLSLVYRSQLFGEVAMARAQMGRAICRIIIFSGVIYLPFVPDVFAAFYAGVSDQKHITGILITLISMGIAWVAVTLVSSLYRLPLILLRSRLGLRLVYLMLLPFLETTQLLFFPFAYVGSMALPFPPAVLQQSHEPEMVSSDIAGELLSLVYDANWSDKTRSRLRRYPEDPRLFKLIQSDLAKVASRGSESVLRVYFPETLFDVSSMQFVALYEFLESAAKERSPFVKHFELLAGIGSAASNLVVWAERDELTGRVKLRRAASKNIPVPFFESSVFGFKFWTAAAEGEAALQRDWSDLMPLRDRDRARADLPLPQFLICYEGLFPQRRNYGSDAVVFTNHNLFSRFSLLSRSYDDILLLLSNGARQRVLLAANSGLSGLAVPWRAWSGSRAFGRVQVVVGSDAETSSAH